MYRQQHPNIGINTYQPFFAHIKPFVIGIKPQTFDGKSFSNLSSTQFMQ
jgi:hypothetical protein